jgi:hypothetical protein
MPVIVPPTTNGAIRFNIDFNKTSTNSFTLLLSQHILLESIQLAFSTMTLLIKIKK